jgi:sugar phosphate permease
MIRVNEQVQIDIHMFVCMKQKIFATVQFVYNTYFLHRKKLKFKIIVPF